VAIAEADGLPEFDDKFVVPRSNLRRDFEPRPDVPAGGDTARGLLIEFAMPEDFLANLQSCIARLESAAESRAMVSWCQVGGTAELAANSLAGMKERKQLMVIVNNQFADDAGLLAEWATVGHIVRS
jgi:hypothetical protein